MWIIFKLAAVICASIVKLCAKYIGPRFDFGKSEDVDGVKVYVRPIKGKHGIVLATRFGFEFRCRSVFKLTEEKDWDGFFKGFGLTTELQTGDDQFDRTVYIASDSSGFREEIVRDAKLREMIMGAFRKGCAYISCDGRTLWMQFPEDETENYFLKKEMAAIYQQMQDIDQSWKGIFHDIYAWKILLVECIVWSLAAYAATSFFEMMEVREDVHFDGPSVFVYGLGAGLFLAALLFALIAVFLRKSSRGHRILVESALLLAIAFPMGGMGVAADINTKLDRSESIEVKAQVTDNYRREHRRRRGSKYYTYHIHINQLDKQDQVDLPRHIEVEYGFWNQAKKDKQIAIEVGQGALKLPWYRSFRLVDAWN